MTTELYRRLVEQSPDGIVISQDGLLVFVNTAAGRLCGAAEPDELLGRSLSDLFNSDPLSDGRESRRRRLEQLMAGQAVAPFEEQIVRLDGALTDVEVALTRLDLPPLAPAPAVVFTMREISERKRADATLRESEERLTLAFAGAQEGVWDWNLVTGDVVYSPRWKQMLGSS